ncbi:MAG TPA: class A beta-lactamase [Candidatus Binataceae bacterium]|nr:class A beta-lactamase [Candidatus Binataceae bacterium]
MTAADDRNGDLQRGVADLERRHGGRLGVAVLDTSTMKLIAHRGDELFPLCSTSKYPTAAFVLARVDRKQESLSRRIVYSRDDLVPYSPFTAKHVGGDGLTVGEICEAALTLSDNTAENLLLDSFGGPMKLTAYTRSLGDSVTRFDRREPELNEAIPGDPRDTTTPVAMLEILHRTILGTTLSASSREQLTTWIVSCKTGDKRLRSGVPKTWRVGDKTGSGPNNVTNDIAVIWPPARAPIVVTAYYAESRGSDDERNKVLSVVGGLAAAV